MKKGSETIPPVHSWAIACPSFASLRLLGDYLTAAIVTALRANVVIHYSCTAVAASCQGRQRRYIVGSSFVSALFGDFSFRMCHCLLFLIFLLFQQFFEAAERGVEAACSLFLFFCQVSDGFGVAPAFRVDLLQRQRNAYQIV